MELARTSSLIAATLTLGLVAGLFFAFAFAVMPGLARSEDRGYVNVFQGINVAIINVWFLIAFIGALVFPAVAVVLHFGRGAVLGWLIAALVLYLATVVITRAVSIPLNDQLAAAPLTDATAAREAFEAAWVRWNFIRTATSVAAFTCAIAALVAR